MISLFAQVLDEGELASLRAHLARHDYAAGAATAGEQIRQVKRNLQLLPGMPGYDGAHRVVVKALERHPEFRRAVFPRLLAPLYFNRYDEGMAYGTHNDAPFIFTPDRGPIRADVSFTLFLADPDSYDGGELVLTGDGPDQPFKLAAGDMVAYPSGVLHRVNPVTRGARLAAVGWVQSLIRRPEHRAALLDIETVRNHLHAREGKSDAFDRLARVYANLARDWAEL